MANVPLNLCSFFIWPLAHCSATQPGANALPFAARQRRQNVAGAGALLGLPPGGMDLQSPI